MPNCGIPTDSHQSMLVQDLQYKQSGNFLSTGLSGDMIDVDTL